MKETVKERAILQEKITEGRINGKNAMTVSDINELKGHRGSAIHGIFITAGRAETAVTTERNKLEISAVDTAIHGTTIRRITTVDHLIDIFHLSRSGMKSIFDLFIMICKDLLQDIHDSIMKEKDKKRNPPLKNEEGTEKHTIFILTLIKKKKSIRVFMILVDFLLDKI